VVLHRHVAIALGLQARGHEAVAGERCQPVVTAFARMRVTADPHSGECGYDRLATDL